MEKPTIDYLIRQCTAIETLYLRDFIAYKDYIKAKDDIFDKVKEQLFSKIAPIGDFDVILAAAIAHSAGYISKTEYNKIVKDLEG